MTETPPTPPEPKLVVGPLAVVALVGLWRGLARRKPLALLLGLGAAAVEVGSPEYRRFKRRWTLLSVTDDEPEAS